MDAKPQRPVRTVRVHDENALPLMPAAAGKAIHQRNKSTPALSTLMQGGALRGVKRTAFADVSNTSRALQSAKDDSVINGKGTSVHVQELVKNTTALSRPAQRPLAAKTVSGNAVTATTTTTTTITTSIPVKTFVEATVPQAQQPTALRTVPRKSTSILSEAPQTNQATSTTTASSADVEHILAQLKASTAASDSPAIDGVILPQPNNALGASVAPQQSVPALPSNDYDPVLPQSHAEQQYYLALEQQAQALEAKRSSKLASQTKALHPVQSEQYYDEEAEDDMYYDEGYTTTRSLRMKGDNTTGGATIVLAPKYTSKVQAEIAAARDLVESLRSPEDVEDELWDTSMVAEYGEEIFDYMRILEDRMRPNPHYMDNQTECQWSMRAVLMDWLVQVHARFGLLPETLFLAVNYIDRFLSVKIVSLAKLQLVGATAIFLASKYEEINCPSIQEIVYMVDNGYTQDEIIKAERFMLSMLAFELGWPGPMSFLRRISKADDYDLETRTLAKYFLEVTIMDERFVGCAPSFTAAGAHCLARLMLRKGDWTPAHVYYSNYTYSQLRQLLAVMMECCEDPRKHHAAVFDKYVDKRYKKASSFVNSEMQRGFKLPVSSRGSSIGHDDAQTWRRA